MRSMASQLRGISSSSATLYNRTLHSHRVVSCRKLSLVNMTSLNKHPISQQPQISSRPFQRLPNASRTSNPVASRPVPSSPPPSTFPLSATFSRTSSDRSFHFSSWDRRARIDTQSGAHYSHLDASVGGGTGDEPGVDVRSSRDNGAYRHLKADTKVTIIDYCSNPEGKNLLVECDGLRLGEWLDSEDGQREVGPDGQPLGIRWIHVEGINWEVIKTLAIGYRLHPLAVEDTLHARDSPRSKVDFYKEHLYLQILILHEEAADESKLQAAAEKMDRIRLPGEAGADNGILRYTDEAERGVKQFTALPEGVEGVFEPAVDPTRGVEKNRLASRKRRQTLTVDRLSAKYMIPVRRNIISAFLMKDGTLLTVADDPVQEVIRPIVARLGDEQSMLRRTNDVSMLAQALLDITVDLAIEVSGSFENEILDLEAAVLVDPGMDTVRQLHVLSSQLIRLRRSLIPLLHVASTLRDQDAQRSAAASAIADVSSRPSPEKRDSQSLVPGVKSKDHGHPSDATDLDAKGCGIRRPSSTNGMTDAALLQHITAGSGAGAASAFALQGFFSPMSKVYLGDVIDHLELVVGNMDQYVATCDHLTDSVFNVLSFQTNASMERLSIVTVVFLPLTFIASYFGMNFTEFPELSRNVSYFWKVAAPATVSFFVIFSFGYLRAGFGTLTQRAKRWFDYSRGERRHTGPGGYGRGIGHGALQRRNGQTGRFVRQEKIQGTRRGREVKR